MDCKKEINRKLTFGLHHKDKDGICNKSGRSRFLYKYLKKLKALRYITFNQSKY